ncbi:DUF885 domain-containing protein [Litoribacter ruber]|uniref:DUF885 domain-containing protein n=1 Tax=Litoribacter ruber TaxID=702568 RepID=UPI001BD9B964|nr:DUF885 domain-containing protein [Litoribacter ruber]MBT0811589.1 DUF885 domain-containing protein [Litoribacter ruber]
MQKFTFLFLATMVFLGLQETHAFQEKDAALNKWLDEQYEELVMMSPLQLTSQGRKERYDEIDDMSEQAEEERLAWLEKSVQEMEANFSKDELSPEAQVSYELWKYQYEMAKEDVEFRRYPYVFEQMRGSHTFLPNMLINYHRVEDVSDMEALISRIRASGRAMNQLLERAILQADMGIRPPKFAYEIVIKEAKGLIAGQPFEEDGEESPLYKDAIGKIEALEEKGEIDSDKASELRQQTEAALREDFKPVYEEMIAWLESELPNLEEKPTGVSRHPNGDAYYQHRLRASTTTDMSADEIHQIGLDEVARIQEEMKQIMADVEFEGDLHEFFEFINTDEQFFYPNTDEGRQGYIDDSKAFLDALTERLPNYFGILPKAELEVKRVEPFREQDGAPQHYSRGTPDGKRPGTYYAHLSDMKAMPKSTMEGVAYHEGNPGHHMQISIAQELEDIPKFRTQMGFNAYVEGWALYSEILAKEMGGYENPYYDFGRLVNEIWRAIRLVVDTGLHSKGWTEEQAVEYFKENSSISDGAIRAEVRRYMVIPGQATGYKIGMLKIQELRKMAEEELGDDFDIKGFHDTVLGGGAMPLDLLEREVKRWVKEKK